MTSRPQPGQSDLKFDNMTREDLKKIEKSMKRPEFMGLLNEYMLEISDPKNKKEYDDYLKQMQSENELPKHMKIVELTPKFCFRTFIVSQKNKNHEMKFFINMCSSEYVQKPSCEPTAGQDGKVGYSWKVPNSMGKIRYDQDKHGNPCQVVDIAFHPDTYFFAVKKEFQEMMINIALEAAERQLGERKETLSRDYIILKKLVCKGQDGKPALLPIRYIEGKMYNKGEGPNQEPERDNQGRETKLQKQINKQKEQHKKSSKQQVKEDKQQQQKEENIQESKPLVQDMDKGVQRPTYRVLPTYSVDYSQFIDDPSAVKRSKVPKTLSIIFNVPRVQSMQQLASQTLQINDKKIVLKIGEIYFIDLQFSQFNLKYVLLTANAKAKYDKKQKTLKIQIPVDQTISYHQNVQQNTKVEEEISKDQIVQHQTWKNKVLDFSDPNISVCQLAEKQQKEEGPKLVEQIEEEDQLPQQRKQRDEQLGQQEQNNQNELQEIKNFSISNYHQKISTVKGYKRLGFSFQETQDSIVLLVRTKGSKRQDITTFVPQNNSQYIIQWKSESDGRAVYFQHIKLKQGLSEKVQKVQVIKRVGAVVFHLVKNTDQFNHSWQGDVLSAVAYEEQTDESRYFKFKQYLTKQLQSLQKQQIQQHLRQQNITEVTDQVQKINEQTQKGKEKLLQNKDSLVDQPKKQVQQQRAVDKQRTQQNIFSNLQPQFILFTAPFIDVLD